MLGQREIRKLIKDKHYRQSTGVFWVDGVNLVHQALNSGLELVLGVSVPTKIDTEFKREVISHFEPSKSIQLGEANYAPLSAKEDIQGVGAVFRIPKLPPALLPGAGVVLEQLSSPGNIGTIARTCLAFGVKNLYVVSPSADPFSFEAVRASMGAVFKLKIVMVSNLEIFKNKEYLSVGTSLQNAVLLPEYKTKSKVSENLLVWFGNEAKGLSTHAKGVCTTLVKIPQSREVDSLNVSESVGITLYSLLDIENE